MLLKQEHGWTYGALLNHISDIGGVGSHRADISSTFVQPFLSRAFTGGRTLTFNLESTYDWKANQWTVPLNIGYSKISKLGSQMIELPGRRTRLSGEARWRSRLGPALHRDAALSEVRRSGQRSINSHNAVSPPSSNRPRVKKIVARWRGTMTPRSMSLLTFQ